MVSEARLAMRERRLMALGPSPSWWRVFARRRWRKRRLAIMAMDVSVMAEVLTRIYLNRIEDMANQAHIDPAGFSGLSKERT